MVDGRSNLRDDMIGGSPQCLRRRFSEHRMVGDREAAKLPKAVISEDACDARPIGLGNEKRLTYEMPSPQGEITDRPHAEMVFARGPKGSLADPDARANLGEIKWPVRMFP